MFARTSLGDITTGTLPMKEFNISETSCICHLKLYLLHSERQRNPQTRDLTETTEEDHSHEEAEVKVEIVMRTDEEVVKEAVHPTTKVVLATTLNLSSVVVWAVSVVDAVVVGSERLHH